MDLGVLAGVQLADWIILIYFLAFFVLGFAQGTIRRLIGIASILFSFLFAANVAAPLGDFLKANWVDQNPEYSYMVGFLTIFVAASLAFAIVVQGFYRPQPLFEKARFVDEIIGGILGLVQAGIVLGAFVVILDSYYRLTGLTPRDAELGFLRDLWSFLDQSQIVGVFRDSIIPAFFTLVGLFIPNKLRSMYPGGAA
ncbi:MAG TPA: CvpA family protein [Candidatus Limnocylindrales bacterium]|nr:CvpA family protein [Candidatus Limnocylindrales bacterium]